jgi:hypothetical protein
MAFLLLGLLFNFNGLWVNLGWALACGLAGGSRRCGPAQHAVAGPLWPAPFLLPFGHQIGAR